MQCKGSIHTQSYSKSSKKFIAFLFNAHHLLLPVNIFLIFGCRRIEKLKKTLFISAGILGTFKQCQKYQEKRDLNTFTSVCILDEVGLAEDSPKMPLKALHPLLEDGCVGDEEFKEWKKVYTNLT